jgi:hypothetical protein
VTTVPTLTAEFDGRVFVPIAPVDLPAGTLVEIVVPKTPARLTVTEMNEWQEIERAIAAGQPHFATLDEAMQYTRKRS